MFNKRFRLALLTGIAVLSCLGAQENNSKLVLSVEDAVKLAQENNISIKQSELSLNMLKKQKDYSWNSVSPTASVSASFNDPLESDAYSYSITGSLNLNLTPSLATTIKAAKLSYESGELSYENTLRSVELSVRKTFYSLIYAKENIALQERGMETSKATYEANLNKYNRGQLSQLDLLTSEYSYESKLPLVNSLKSSYENSIAGFKQVLGIRLSQEIELSGSLSDALDIKLTEDILQGNLDEIPSVKTINQSLLSAKNSLLATRFAAWGPSLSLGYTYGKSGTAGVNGISFGDSLENLNTTNNLSIGIKIPLDGYLPWSSGALSIANQKSNIENLELQLENAKTSAAIAVRNSYNTIVNAQAQYNTYKANVELMTRTYEMTLEAYNNGSRDLLALQNAEDNLLSARTTLQNQTYTLISAVLDLENTLGVPFGTLSK